MSKPQPQPSPSRHRSSTCDACRRRPSAFHLTHEVNGESRRMQICQHCAQLPQFAALKPYIAMLRQARCCFCEQPATVGGADPLAGMFGVERHRFLCAGCADRYREALQQYAVVIPKDWSHSQRLGLLVTVSAKLERDLKAQVPKAA
jgi:hypothetical protein